MMRQAVHMLWRLLPLGMIFSLFIASPPAYAASLSEIVVHQAHSVQTQTLDQQVKQLLSDYPTVHVPTVTQLAEDLLNQRAPFDVQQFLTALARSALGDAGSEGQILGLILVLAVLASMLSRMTDALEDNGGLAHLTEMVVVSAVLLLALRSFDTAVGMVTGLVDNLVHLMESMIPLLTVLLAGSGAVASAGIFHPLMVMTVNTVAMLTTQWVFPLVIMATVAELISQWLPRFSLKNLAQLLRQTGLTLLGGLLTIFLGVMAVEGAAGSVADGLMLRTSKFLVSTFVPVVGKMFSDSMEAILGSSMLLKNAVSVVGALTVIVAVAFPLVKLMLMM
ncbi:MAG: stage III sporulation protein AE, partial [Firmicutes bacterium]|nr:stage III sporulation protein AE [Bacillota bacterium]